MAQTSYTNTARVAIPDGNVVGLTETFNVSGLSDPIADVQLSLDITGGFNGDLYAYLAGPEGQLAILLNRVGVTGSNPFGYNNAGMNITLDGLAVNNIHDYQDTPGYSLNGTEWAADGRNVNPQSSGSVLYGTPTISGLSVFANTDPNGLWTLFIADMSGGGGLANLQQATLTIMEVPEPRSWALALVGGVLGWILIRKKQKKETSESPFYLQ
jgi:subtilisin-like proprotein convertase family protein